MQGQKCQNLCGPLKDFIIFFWTNFDNFLILMNYFLNFNHKYLFEECVSVSFKSTTINFIGLVIFLCLFSQKHYGRILSQVLDRYFHTRDSLNCTFKFNWLTLRCDNLSNLKLHHLLWLMINCFWLSWK